MSSFSSSSSPSFDVHARSSKKPTHSSKKSTVHISAEQWHSYDTLIGVLCFLVVVAIALGIAALFKSPLTKSQKTLFDNIATLDFKALTQLRVVDGILVVGNPSDPASDGVFVASLPSDSKAKTWLTANADTIGKSKGILLGGPSGGNNELYWYWQKSDGTVVGLIQGSSFQP